VLSKDGVMLPACKILCTSETNVSLTISQMTHPTFFKVSLLLKDN